MTLWLDQVSKLDGSGRNLDPNKPEYVSEHVLATRFDKFGQIAQRLTADKLWQYPKNNDLYFDNGYIRVMQNGALDYSVSAETGRYNTHNKLGYFNRKVHMLKPASGTQPQTTLDTSAMSIDANQRQASSEMPVEVHYGTSIATATGFTYDYNAGVVNLLSFARVTYAQ